MSIKTNSRACLLHLLTAFATFLVRKFFGLLSHVSCTNIVCSGHHASDSGTLGKFGKSLWEVETPITATFVGSRRNQGSWELKQQYLFCDNINHRHETQSLKTNAGFEMQHHFFFSSHVLLLFKEWQIDSAGVLVGAVIGVFLFTFLYEIASFYQSHHAKCGANVTSSCQTHYKEGDEPHSYGTFESGHLRSSSENTENTTIPFHVRVSNIALTPRYILNSLSLPFLLAANYFIMLSVMTYNAWLLIAVCLASGLAYFVLQADRDVPTVKPHRDGATTPLLSRDENLILNT